jgi:carboxyl-terminal processing protease
MGFATRALLPVALSVLAGCSGDGGADFPGNPPSGNTAYTAAVFPASSTFAAQCAAPRAGTSDRTGTAFTENMFLRSWTNELYLWYGEVQDRDPTGIATAQYFDMLKTTQVTASGTDKDQFHFTYPTSVWQQLSQAGIDVGYGAQFLGQISGNSALRIFVAYVEPNTPAAAANLSRGVEILAADGLSVATVDTDAEFDSLEVAVFPTTAGQAHTFRIRELSGTERDVTMTTTQVTHDPVPIASVIDQSGVPVGYLLFNDHVATAESELVEAVNTLRAANVQDLILDLRYNGGGYLDIASELAYMIAGVVPTSGQPFERLVFNDKNPSTNPVTGQPLSPKEFHTTTQGFDLPRGFALPTLNLPRVYVITGGNTCSASESIINGLRGVGVEVYQIGSRTCGKPYGFYPRDNCGTTYFSIQFQGLNARGFGAYADGFTPQLPGDPNGATLSGCYIADDFTRQLGDATERRLQAALSFRASNNQTCPPIRLGSNAQGKSGESSAAGEGILFRAPTRENRMLRDGSFEPPSSATRVRMLNTPEPRE